MLARDVLMLGVVFPALVVPLWTVVLRVWRRGEDIYDQAGPVKWVTPESARHGYHAFLLPAVISMTLSGPVTAAYVVWEHGGLQWLGGSGHSCGPGSCCRLTFEDSGAGAWRLCSDQTRRSLRAAIQGRPVRDSRQ